MTLACAGRRMLLNRARERLAPGSSYRSENGSDHLSLAVKCARHSRVATIDNAIQAKHAAAFKKWIFARFDNQQHVATRRNSSILESDEGGGHDASNHGGNNNSVCLRFRRVRWAIYRNHSPGDLRNRTRIRLG
jgi:hypothetical protein